MFCDSVQDEIQQLLAPITFFLGSDRSLNVQTTFFQERLLPSKIVFFVMGSERK